MWRKLSLGLHLSWLTCDICCEGDRRMSTAALHTLRHTVYYESRSRWPCSPKRRSADDWLLGLWVRIRLMAWIFVSCVCYASSQHFEKRLSASSCLSALRPSICLSTMQQLSSHWTDFYEIWYLRVFRKFIKKIQLSIKSDKNNGYFTWRPMYIYDNSSLNSY
jgi:hypothetical protein